MFFRNGERGIYKKEDLTIYKEIDSNDLDTILNFLNTADKDDMFYNAQIGEFSCIGEGYYGIVYGYKNYAIKMTKSCCYESDSKNLCKLQGLKSFPDIYCNYKDDFVIMECIEGSILDDVYSFETVDDNVLVQLYEDIKSVIKLQINPKDIHPFNIMLDNKGFLKIVDVGNFHITNIDITWIENPVLFKERLKERYLVDIQRYIQKIENELMERKEYSQKIA